MKVLSRLCFTLYIAFLAVLPCGDKKIAVEGVNDGSYISVAGLDHSNRDVHLCTPFCICSCCSTHIRLTTTFQVASIDQFHNTLLITPYTEKPSVKNSQNIWQPPKVA